MLFKIESNPMHPLSGALPLPDVPACVTRGALAAHRHSFEGAPLCPSRCLFWNDLSDPVFDGLVWNWRV